MRFFQIIPTLLLIMSLAGVRVAFAEAKLTDPKLSPFKLALNWKAEPEFGGFYEAREKSFFQNEGLKVEILEGGSATPTIQLLQSGQVQAAVVSGDELLMSYENGSKDVVALFATFQVNPQAILVREGKNRPGTLVELLKDGSRTLLWQQGAPYALFLQKKFSPLKIKTAPYKGSMAPFFSDPLIAQQGFVTSEPILAKTKGVEAHSFLVAEAGFNPYAVVLAARRSDIEKSPAIYRALVRSVQAGWKSYLKSPDSTNELMNRLNPSMDLATFKASAEAQKALIETTETQKQGLGHMTNQRWEALQEQLGKVGLLKTRVSVSEIWKKFD